MVEQHQIEDRRTYPVEIGKIQSILHGAQRQIDQFHFTGDVGGDRRDQIDRLGARPLVVALAHVYHHKAAERREAQRHRAAERDQPLDRGACVNR